MNCPEAALSRSYPPSATTPECIQPARTACIGGSGSWLADDLAELAHCGGTTDLAVTVPVQAAGHGGWLSRLGERVRPLHQDRRRAMHSPVCRFLVVIHH